VAKPVAIGRIAQCRYSR